MDAFFETVSGFTTTGATILPDVEALSRGMLFWRSFTHWIGGLKVSRLTILCKMIRRELRHTLRPRMVDVIKVDGHQLSEQTAHSIVVYFALYMLCVAGLLVALSFSPFDLETNLFASISCFNNVGPGFGMVGPLGNYSPYSPAIKLFLCAGMLLGRLEIYPMLLLFVPAAWRKK